jgi:predicted negative regulator of RcsB-dependent stress response
MKRTERHHLKKDELQNLMRRAQEAFETRRGEMTTVVVLVAVLVVAAVGWVAWRERGQTKADALLAEALTVQGARVGPPPAPGTPSGGLYFATDGERAQAALARFKVAADAYPASDAGIYARYQEASTSLALGGAAQAAAAYQQVIAASGDGLYGQMARLGLAEAQVAAGQFEPAINTYKELSQRKDGSLPVDGILMQLGRAYLGAGRRTEAQLAFTTLVDEYPESPFRGDAQRELDNLKKS